MHRHNRDGDGDLAVGRHHADDDGLFARGEGREGSCGQGDVADGFDGDVDLRVAAGVEDGLEEILAGRVDGVGRTEESCGVPAVRFGVDRDDAGGAADPRGLDRAQADASAAGNEHGLARPEQQPSRAAASKVSSLGMG